MRPNAWAEGVEQDNRVAPENDGGSRIGPEGSSNSTPSIAAKRARIVSPGFFGAVTSPIARARYFPRFFFHEAATFSRAHAGVGLPDLSREVNFARRSICSLS
ncbi:hypothetical protein CQW49_22645 (plasmid) [Methylosinus trichosporium OB3b]|uniref:Uncharacterized protein n=1 Tax=Methylosinus trichosporium (strain ATCC 35070 / NCIMB 11131 / UNIQEM 75 / OB3b) TaxID=595536 RepID=A0A2D2D733_METT3|nr:hypothetical protein [Methylosinus trichosporium]ATQ70783.1 hypothetical protein CQW49_22645 [Methylosinus trichosporium OB3b]